MTFFCICAHIFAYCIIFSFKTIVYIGINISIKSKIERERAIFSDINFRQILTSLLSRKFFANIIEEEREGAFRLLNDLRRLSLNINPVGFSCSTRVKRFTNLL